ncbi:MAG: molybdenum cofactor guanylyltransferase [Candidatus Ranarchaeia archaeon]|jgi:molybdopterin-guanine dinucleotide biosynthesis protein A
MDIPIPLTIAILAGGSSNRLPNKVSMDLHGTPLVVHVLRQVSRISPNVLLVLHDKNQNEILRPILPKKTKIVYDVPAPKPSALVGIISALKIAKTEHVLILPGDAPFIHHELLHYLISFAPKYNAIIPQWPNGWVEPLHAIYSKNAALPVFMRYFPETKKRLIEIIREIPKVHFIPIDELRKFDPDLLSFVNVNTPQDFKQARSISSSKQ